MDVQALAAAAQSPQPEPALPAPASGGGIGVAPNVPPAPLQADPLPHAESGPLSPIVAKILAQGSMPHPVSVNVSYRVEHDPNMIVTVFTDPNTGAEIAQVPAEVMVQMAQFFDKQSGVTLDRSV